MTNLGIRSTNASGFTGVSWNRAKGKWVASGYKHFKRIHLGYFDNIDDAINARIFWAAFNNPCAV